MEDSCLTTDTTEFVAYASTSDVGQASTEHLEQSGLTAPKHVSSWSVEDSEQLYRLREWGEPYFSINAAGHITVSPKGDRGGSLDLYKLVQALQERDLNLPLLIRFSDILEDRIERLNACFSKAIGRYDYAGEYRGVFPIKCNQQRHLIESLIRYGQTHQLGLEAGSKPELLIVIATLNTPGALIVCNGYMDREYVETALLAQRLGHHPILVVEQLREISLIIETSRRLGIQPTIGIRAKLSTKGSGRWGISAGDRAKFGLTAPEILLAVEQLRSADLLDSLQLLHFHIGSQISSIRVIKDALREASWLYVELAHLGANMQYLDVGGGLGVDYDGSKSQSQASKNYNMQNYANDVVAQVNDTCTEANIPVPTLISESGRALVSHQSVLLFDVLGSSDICAEVPASVQADEHRILRILEEIYQSIDEDNYQETYHDALQFKEEAVSQFVYGHLSLPERARAEQYYWACCAKIANISHQQVDMPDDLQDIEQLLASIYYVNLSIFQSAPDTWAIDQLFPILPIHRLNEKPTARGTLADLTCDSDGKITQFISNRETKSVLELHPLNSGEPYCLGMFLNGAYQEILGNLHNLFGDTHTVHIQLTSKGYEIEHVVKGDTMTEVLGYVQYDADDLIEDIRQQTERALQEGSLTLAEAKLMLKNYERSLRSYTYLSR